MPATEEPPGPGGNFPKPTSHEDVFHTRLENFVSETAD